MTKRNVKKLENRRLQGYRLLKKGVSQSEVARQLGVTRQTVHEWKKSMEESFRSWRAKDLGRPMRLTLTELRKSASTVRRGVSSMNYRHEKWTLELIATIIGYKYNVHYSPSHVSRIMHQMGFSCQKPPSSDQKSLKAWEKYGWYSTVKKSINPVKSKNPK